MCYFTSFIITSALISNLLSSIINSSKESTANANEFTKLTKKERKGRIKERRKRFT